MPQFTPQPPSSPFPLSHTEGNGGARPSPKRYPQEPTEPVYRHPETQRIKNLSFWSNKDKEPQEEEEWIERQSAAPFILALIILVVASTLLWFLFQWASNENTSLPLVIPADTAPFKVRPQNPGGLAIPHQDKLVYSRLSQNAPQPIERLLPPPEQPMAAPITQHPLYGPATPQPHPDMAHPAQPYYPQGSYPSHPAPNQGYAPPTPGYPAPPPPQQPLPFPESGSPSSYPHFQGTPSPTLHPQPFAPQAPYGPPPPKYSPYGPPASMPSPVPLPPLAPAQQPMATAPSKVSNVEDIKPASSEQEDNSVVQEGLSELDELIAREAAVPLKRAGRKENGKLSKASSLDPQAYKIQIASLPSRTLAEEEMRRLRMHHDPSLGSKSWVIQKVNTTRGSIHRVVVGSFPNQNAALKVCKKLRSGGAKCQVIAPAHN